MRDTLTPLTSLRFFAALVIVFHHLAGVMWFEAGAFEPYPLDSAVAFFFVLSGFVLHYNYGTRMREVGWKSFAVQRIMRIWPLHVVVLIICAAWLSAPDVRFHLERQTTAEVFQIIFLLQAWSQKPIVFWGLNGPSWSISAELFFYLAFPTLALALARFGGVMFMFGTAVFTAGWLTFATVFFYSAEKELSALALGYVSPAARIGEFCLGMVLSYLLSDRLSMLRGQSRWLWSALELFALAAMVVCVRSLPQIGWHVEQAFGPVAGAWAGASGALLCFALVIGVFAVGRGVVSSAMCHPRLVWLGTISFAMYLIHQPLIYFWARHVVPALGNTALEMVIFAMALVLLSALLHRWIEQPSIVLGKRWSKRLAPTGRGPVAADRL